MTLERQVTARKSLDTVKDSFPLYSPCETPNIATAEQNEQHPQNLPGGGGGGGPNCQTKGQRKGKNPKKGKGGKKKKNPPGPPGGGGGEARTGRSNGNDKEQTTYSEKDDANKTRRRDVRAVKSAKTPED